MVLVQPKAKRQITGSVTTVGYISPYISKITTWDEEMCMWSSII